MSSLSGKYAGLPDYTFKDLLHFHGGAAAYGTTGAQMFSGDGRSTGLVFGATFIGINNGTQTTRLETLATAYQTITFPNASGTLMLGDGTGLSDPVGFKDKLGVKVIQLAETTTTSSSQALEVPGFSFVPARDSTYRVEMYLRVQSASDTVPVRMWLNGPWWVDFILLQFDDTAVRFKSILENSAIGMTSGNIEVDTDKLIKVTGIFKTSDVPSPMTAVSLNLRSEVNGTEVRLMKGSTIISHKLT